MSSLHRPSLPSPVAFSVKRERRADQRERACEHANMSRGGGLEMNGDLGMLPDRRKGCRNFRLDSVERWRVVCVTEGGGGCACVWLLKRNVRQVESPESGSGCRRI
ncbi:hypothetical protein HanIR_Chr11g0558321 [Helianthus annuus]|nr:hypothetical protein HanIR_Chr11g0558321 [Helianthus annuus]